MGRPRAIAEKPEGLRYRPDFVSEDEERSLLGFLAALEFREVVMRGQVARRTVRHFGWDYGYESWALVPAEPLPDALRWLRDRSAELAEIEPHALSQTLVSRYPPGAGIGWHRDAPMFGGTIVGVSLGTPARMRFQRTVQGTRRTWELPLEPRSAYVLAGAARSAWQHSIPAGGELRHSITFRTVRNPQRWSG
ncbi:MAG: alpha-ketoglutarate-dependent dioxygenase AlkB [Thermoleophilia bacterium]|nr:alpha-ketoglutarate-dependent dioxygenase AlkB [Thermoleophilia bacterium]